jgi:hypothetical protein
VERQYVKDNARSRKRLAKLVKNLTDEELQLVIYKEGWTIAAALAHIAFWDERRRVMLKVWKRKKVATPRRIGVIVNDVLIPFLLAIPPRKAAELAVLTAEALDKEIEELSPEMLKAIKALKDPLILNRAIHRKMHLDEIEAVLKNKRPSV